MKKTMPVDETTLTLLERLDYETMSASNTIATLVETSSDTSILTSDLFQRYEKDYTLKFMEYELAKQEINKSILKDYDDKKFSLSWEINFSSAQMILNIDENQKDQYEEKILIDIDPSELSILENLYYSAESKRAIIIKILNRNRLNTNAASVANSAAFKEYQLQLAKVEVDCEREKERLSSQLMPSNVDGIASKWNINFLDSVFEVYVMHYVL